MKALVFALVSVVSSIALAGPGYPNCSTAGDQTARPVYKTVNGKLVLVGWECVQDNRGGGGGVRF